MKQLNWLSRRGILTKTRHVFRASWKLETFKTETSKTVSKSVRDSADKLLNRLLRMRTDLLWRPELLAMLLGALDSTDGAGEPIPVDTRISTHLTQVTPGFLGL